MRPEEIRELTDEEIRGRIAELEEERFRLRFRSATETLDNPLRFRVIRKDIARMKTILRERQLAAERGAAPTASSTTTSTESRRGRRSAAR